VVAVLVPAAARPGDLAVGDVVNVVIAAGSDGSDPAVIEGAVVHAVDRQESDDALVVALRTSVKSAGVIAAADPARVRLVLVAP
jgi:hypothetical protein